MKYANIEKLTMEIVKQYYQGDTTLFFQYMHPDAVFLSVGKGQIIEGAEAIKRSFTKMKKNPIRYDIVSMTCKSYVTSNRNLYVILQMNITAYFPNGSIQKVNQRLTADWKNYRNQELAGKGVVAGWLFRNVHLSVAMETHKPSITLTHISENFLYEATGLIRQEKKNGFRDVKTGQVHYVSDSQLVRIQADRSYAYIFRWRESVLGYVSQ